LVKKVLRNFRCHVIHFFTLVESSVVVFPSVNLLSAPVLFLPSLSFLPLPWQTVKERQIDEYTNHRTPGGRRRGVERGQQQKRGAFPPASETDHTQNEEQKVLERQKQQGEDIGHYCAGQRRNRKLRTFTDLHGLRS